MSHDRDMDRRTFLGASLASAGALGAAGGETAARQETQEPKPAIPLGTIGKAKISRLLLGGNLIGGWMHARDLKYVDGLFKAYATEAKMLETLQIAESLGINTVFETGANFIDKYNRTMGGHMQFIPHIQVDPNPDEAKLKDHIRKQVDTGAVALYIWGVSGDRLVRANAAHRIAQAVEMAKAHGLPVGVGSHSLLVPMECEKLQVPCDFYVKTLHRDDYFSATPKPLRKEFIWITGGEGWHDNMWCINPEETIEFMKTVKKPWIAFKVLAAGAYMPRDGFDYAVKHGADFLAVGMLDFHLKGNVKVFCETLARHKERARPWMG
jgi:hypothetical protein